MRKIRRVRYGSKGRISFRNHKHIFKIGRMKGLSSIPVRFRGRRI